MKPVVCFWTFFFFLFAFAPLQAQEVSDIIKELNRNDPSKGKVVVYQDESIKDVVGKPVASLRSGDGSSTVRVTGYKIQAFSGNDPRTSKNEAYSKQSMINGAFPGLETKIIFDSPFWRLRVGNFKSREDAEAVMSQMSQKFPSFGKEMYIVRDEVRIAVDD
ncbi:MAG: SPOR domain-containing protein [Dysgonamonadaceae bacterium]|jgi:hypothetical protein|nr:SPOR domain-containing protein [Dysgonamonadaceae bacterium]